MGGRGSSRRPCSSWLCGRHAGGQRDLGAVLQAVKVAGDYGLVFGEARDGADVLIGVDDGDVLERDGLIRLDDVDEGLLSVVLDGYGGDEERVCKRADLQARVDELVGKELSLRVVKDGAQLDGACGGVDLIVEREQLAGGE